MKCKKCNTNGQLSGVHTKYVLVISLVRDKMSTQIVRYENEYNDHMKKKKMMMSNNIRVGNYYYFINRFCRLW